MDTKKIIRNIEKIVEQALSKEGTGHDWWHIVRVRNNAKAILQKEKADVFVVDLAVLLHDVGDRKVIDKEEDDHTIAKEYLERESVSKEIIDHVMFIIENMSFSKSLDSKREDVSLEFQVVQDADRLDALGAIGIARAFIYGGSKGRPMYDPTKQAQKTDTTENYRKHDSSTFHHFEEKLLKLKDLMNTKTGKEIAQNRHEYMLSYTDRFLKEWNGEL